MTKQLNRHTHWSIVPIGDATRVRTDRPLDRVFWVCGAPPSRLLGSLLEDISKFEGAWVENFRLLVQVGGRREVFEVPDAAPSDRVRLAERALRGILAGQPPSAIQHDLSSVREARGLAESA